MQLEGHAASAWQPSRGWGETGRTSDSAVDGERREADAPTAHLVEAPDAAEAFAEEPRPVTPDVLAGFDSAIRQLRSQIAELRTVLRERKVAGEHKKAQMATLNMALNGAPREEAERYLAQNFQLTDPEPILDDAYGRES